MANWDASLPANPMTRTVREQAPDNQIRSKTDTGPVKHRPRSTAVPTPVSQTFRMTRAQVLTHETFYKTTLADGALPFDFVDTIRQVTVTMRYTDAYTVQMIGPDSFDVAVKWERLV